ncbi:hypothetical protein DL98DRAFT_654803 [Cadophora sp. DSE1049]|nr:hypothetical protein DL98DRAFT_654803 [Cadophora sp. DSE1049]
MNPSTSLAKAKTTTTTSSKKRPAHFETETDTKTTTSQPAPKNARTSASQTTKVAKPKKGPACAACRKKKIRAKLGSVTKQPSALLSPSLANEQAKPSSSVNTSSSHPTKVANHSASSEAPEPTKTASPAAPKKFRKLDEDRNATPEFRERIERERQKYTVQFTEEDWYREPKWASRVYGGWDSVDELLLHAKAPRNESSAELR